MFFMMSIMDGIEDFDFSQTIICDLCGKYGRYQVYMTYTVLSLFFIPVFKWNKRYYVRSSCCNAEYELTPEIGRAISNGEHVEILSQHLTAISSGNGFRQNKYCKNCGYTTTEDFDFCPKCGNKL